MKREAEVEEGNRKTRDFHAQSILVVGFLGGIAVAAMLLVIQAKSTFAVPNIVFGFRLGADAYFHFIISLLALDTIIFAFSGFAMIFTASGMLKDKGLLKHFITVTFALGFCGFVIALMSMLNAVSKVGFWVAIGFIVVLLIFLNLSFDEQTRPDSSSGKTARRLSAWLSSLRSNRSNNKNSQNETIATAIPASVEVTKVEESTKEASPRN